MVLLRKGSGSSKAVEYVFLDPSSYNGDETAHEVFTHILGRKPKISLLSSWIDKVFYTLLDLESGKIHILGLHDYASENRSSRLGDSISINSVSYLDYLAFAEIINKTKDLNEEAAPLPKYLRPERFIKDLSSALREAHQKQEKMVGSETNLSLSAHPRFAGRFLSTYPGIFGKYDSPHVLTKWNHKSELWNEFLARLKDVITDDSVVDEVINGIERETEPVQRVFVKLKSRRVQSVISTELSFSFQVPYRDEIKDGKIFWLIYPVPLVLSRVGSSDERLGHILFYGAMVILLENPVSTLIALEYRQDIWGKSETIRDTEPEGDEGSKLPTSLKYSREMFKQKNIFLKKGFTLHVLPKKQEKDREGALITVRDHIDPIAVGKEESFAVSFNLDDDSGGMHYYIADKEVSSPEFYKRIVRYLGELGALDSNTALTLLLNKNYGSICVPVSLGQREIIYPYSKEEPMFNVLLFIREFGDKIFDKMIRYDSNPGPFYLLDLAMDNPSAFIEFIRRRRVFLILENFVYDESTTILREIYLKNKRMLLSESDEVEFYISFH